jgi:pimeloyl-ACP methyl ester carboxylesterase
MIFVVRLFPRSRKRRATIVVALLGYTLLMTFGGCADRLILYPSTGPLRLAGTERFEVPVAGARPVEVWVARSEGASGREPEAFALEFIGNASRAEYMAAAAAQEWGGRPVEVWSVNYPGYGGSPGPARLASIAPAALAAYDALKSRAGTRPIFLTGQSLGTTAALHVAANRPVAGMVLASPPPLRDMILKRFGWWNLWLLAGPVAMNVPAPLDSLRNAPKVTAPAVFVLTGKDTVVPLKYQRRVADAYRGPKRYVRRADAEHNDLLEGPAAAEYQSALDWLWSQTVKPTLATAPATSHR